MQYYLHYVKITYVMNKFPIKLKRFKSKPNKTRASNLKRANQFLKNVNTCETWSVFRIDLILLFITLSYLSWFKQREDDHPSFFTRTKTISDPLKTGKSASNGDPYALQTLEMQLHKNVFYFLKVSINIHICM